MNQNTTSRTTKQINISYLKYQELKSRKVEKINVAVIIQNNSRNQDSSHDKLLIVVIKPRNSSWLYYLHPNTHEPIIHQPCQAKNSPRPWNLGSLFKLQRTTNDKCKSQICRCSRGKCGESCRNFAALILDALRKPFASLHEYDLRCTVWIH